MVKLSILITSRLQSRLSTMQLKQEDKMLLMHKKLPMPGEPEELQALDLSSLWLNMIEMDLMKSILISLLPQ